ncbi:MAG: hypothetical protein RMI45_00850 [Ignisphaera sp.]|nr:hypothetical protein [Ignisphaera sp.]MDW8084774.1 hypothetical protein [Ignisphaera sp.]
MFRHPINEVVFKFFNMIFGRCGRSLSRELLHLEGRAEKLYIKSTVTVFSAVETLINSRLHVLRINPPTLGSHDV